MRLGAASCSCGEQPPDESAHTFEEIPWRSPRCRARQRSASVSGRPAQSLLGSHRRRIRGAVGAQAPLAPHADAPHARRLRARRHDVRPRRRPRQGFDRLRGHELGRHRRDPAEGGRDDRGAEALRDEPGPALRGPRASGLAAPVRRRVPAARHEAHERPDRGRHGAYVGHGPDARLRAPHEPPDRRRARPHRRRSAAPQHRSRRGLDSGREALRRRRARRPRRPRGRRALPDRRPAGARPGLQRGAVARFERHS